MGRLSVAAVRIADPRVAEAHALVTLRGRGLRLEALQGWLAVGGRHVGGIDLEEGQAIALARGLVVEVEHVVLPRTVLALEFTALPSGLPTTHELSGSIYSITDVAPGLHPVMDLGAPAHVMSTGDGWCLRMGGPVENISPGRRWTVAGWSVRAVALEIGVGEGVAPIEAERREELAMYITTRFNTAYFHVPGRPSFTLVDDPARVVGAMAARERSAPWDVVAQEIWPEVRDLSRLRERWDTALRRLRACLSEAGVRDDLVRSDGAGNIELHLMDGDLLYNDS